MALSTLIQAWNTCSDVVPHSPYKLVWVSHWRYSGFAEYLKIHLKVDVGLKLLFPSKPNSCVLSLWTNFYFRLCWYLAASPGIASLHRSFGLGPILCPHFGSPENSLPQRQPSPLWLGRSGAVWDCVGLCWTVQSSAKKNSSVKYFFFDCKYFMSLDFHSKLVGHKVIKQPTSLQHRSCDFHLSQFPFYAQRCFASFFGTTVIALHLQGKEGYRLWRLGFLFDWFCFVLETVQCIYIHKSWRGKVFQK